MLYPHSLEQCLTHCMYFTNMGLNERKYIVLAFMGGYHKEPQSEWLKQQKFVVSYFWRQESEIKVPAGLILSEASEGRICSRPLFLT